MFITSGRYGIGVRRPRRQDARQHGHQNIHFSLFGGGEIRGQLVRKYQTASLALLGIALWLVSGRSGALAGES
jgi:hypothetical protein